MKAEKVSKQRHEHGWRCLDSMELNQHKKCKSCYPVTIIDARFFKPVPKHPKPRRK